MPDTIRIDLAPELAHALSILDGARAAINEIYNTARGTFYTAAKKSVNIHSPCLSRGRAEHEVYAVRALGILEAGSDQQIKRLLRAGNRYAYDKIAASPVPLSLAAMNPDDVDAKKSLNMDEWAASMTVALGSSAVLGKPALQDDVFMMLYELLDQHRRADSSRPKRDEISIERLKKATGISGTFTSFDGLYDAVRSDDLHSILDDIAIIADAERTDPSIYTLGVSITPADAQSITYHTSDPVLMLYRASILLLLRAMRKDRDFALAAYREDRADESAAARIEAEQARAALDDATRKNKLLAEQVEKLTREKETLQKRLDDEAQNRDELSALRSAVYRSMQSDDVISVQSSAVRSLPDGVVVIGGHPAWAQLMQQEAPSLRIYPSGVSCPPSVVSSASEVWFQAQYLGHTDFYRAVEVARRLNIPVRYFSGTGVGRCLADLYAAD